MSLSLPSGTGQTSSVHPTTCNKGYRSVFTNPLMFFCQITETSLLDLENFFHSCKPIGNTLCRSKHEQRKWKQRMFYIVSNMNVAHNIMGKPVDSLEFRHKKTIKYYRISISIFYHHRCWLFEYKKRCFTYLATTLNL